MKFCYQFFAVTAPGLEKVCAAELRALGFPDALPEPGGVAFSGALRELYLANLALRTASRVLVRIGRIHCRDFPALFQKTVRLPWGSFVRPGTPLLVKAASHASRLVHSGRIAETVAAAVSHALGTPAANPDLPQQLVLARFEDDECLLSVDSSGELLHRRGYRTDILDAPLRETLAAGILMVLGWDGKTPLLDPMCGSGTFPIEAALLAINRAPGRGRRFAFMNWPHFRPGLWAALLQESLAGERLSGVSIFGSDQDPSALEAAIANARRAGVAEQIRWEKRSLETLWPPSPSGLLVANPPYGRRLGIKKEAALIFRELGVLLRGPFHGWTGAFLSPEPILAQATGLPLQVAAELVHGGLKVGLYVRSL